MRVAGSLLVVLFLALGSAHARAAAPAQASTSAQTAGDARSIAGCEMGRGRAEIGTEGRLVLVLAAFVGLLVRRQYKKKADGEAMAALDEDAPAAKPKLKKLRKLRGGIVKHRAPSRV